MFLLILIDSCMISGNCAKLVADVAANQGMLTVFIKQTTLSLYQNRNVQKCFSAVLILIMEVSIMSNLTHSWNASRNLV